MHLCKNINVVTQTLMARICLTMCLLQSQTHNKLTLKNLHFTMSWLFNVLLKGRLMFLKPPNLSNVSASRPPFQRPPFHPKTSLSKYYIILLLYNKSLVASNGHLFLYSKCLASIEYLLLKLYNSLKVWNNFKLTINLKNSIKTIKFLNGFNLRLSIIIHTK